MKNRLLCYRDFMTEGLITTHPISIHKNQLINDIKNLNIFFDIKTNDINENFEILLKKTHLMM